MTKNPPDFSGLKVFLVESDTAMRSAIYYMLRDLGVDHVSTSGLSSRVQENFLKERFDVVMLAHNGHGSITGIQVLEEARFRGYMRPTSVWILTTADASQELILHALDSQPDAVIAKPFSKEELKRRLVSLIDRKRRLRDVDEAMEQDDLEGVLIACDRIDRTSLVYDEAQLIRAKTLLKMDHPNEAFQMLERRYWETSDKYVGFYLAESLIALERFDEADAVLKQLLTDYPLFIQSYDLLARLHELQGDLIKATDMLHEATKLSPLGIPRNIELGRVATQSNSYDLAKSTLKRAIKLGKNSCYHSPDPFLRLVNISRLEIQTADEKTRTALAREAESMLTDAENLFPDNPALRVKTAISRSQMFSAMGDETAAAKAMKDAETRNLALATPVNIERESALMTLDPVPTLQPIQEGNSAEPEAKKRDPEMSAKVNRLGVKHYVSGNMSQAIRYFGMATEYDSKNSQAYLNLAQLFLESGRDDLTKRAERFRMVDRYLKLTQKMTMSPETSKRHAMLQFYREKSDDSLPAGSLGVPLQ